jgi:HEAT repeat protein
VLASDSDAGVRSKAAEVLGRQGSEKCLRALAEAAGTDKTTDILRGCILGKSSARRTAMFAIADLVGRFPKLADQAATELRGLRAVEDPTDSESLADARRQSLYRVTGDKALLTPFYERLRSEDAKIRRDGVVAFQFCGLKIAPAEVTAAMADADPEVRSWAALVLGEIGDVKTVPALLAMAEDTKQDIGLRCNAIHSIGRMKVAGMSTAVRRLLEDPNEAVQAQAAIALYRITGEKVSQFPAGYNAD